MAIAGIGLAFAGTYVAFDIIRVTTGAPRAWYIVIAAFLTMLVHEVIRLGFAIQVQDTFEDDLDAALLLVFGLLLLSGLALLDRAFRRHSKVLQPG
ncbi:MAG TPA: hypothetical protein VJR06_03265 [Nitrososphaerales archaeon]|nr:hypothetical protein [Nitrososphaerales archaeon]